MTPQERYEYNRKWDRKHGLFTIFFVVVVIGLAVFAITETYPGILSRPMMPPR